MEGGGGEGMGGVCGYGKCRIMERLTFLESCVASDSSAAVHPQNTSGIRGHLPADLDESSCLWLNKR